MQTAGNEEHEYVNEVRKVNINQDLANLTQNLIENIVPNLQYQNKTLSASFCQRLIVVNVNCLID